MIENAKITATSLSMEDHGCLTLNLVLEGRGWGVSYGGYCLGKGYLGAKEFKGSAKGLEAIMRIMDVVGVSRYEDLVGKYVRVEVRNWGDTISKIGNIISDKWFDYREFFREENSDD